MSENHQHYFPLLAVVVLLLSMLVGCGPSTSDLKAVEYAPLFRDDWDVAVLFIGLTGHFPIDLGSILGHPAIDFPVKIFYNFRASLIPPHQGCCDLPSVL